ncbi:STAS/SEC14 domain-containing protein [Acidobacteriota bacterium]
MTKEITDTRMARLWVETDKVVFIDIKPAAEFDVADIKELQEISLKLAGGCDYVICADINNIKSVTKEARDFSGDEREINKSLLAMALITVSPISRVIGNLFMGLNKPPYPAKLFSDKEKAIEWLKDFFT